MTRKKTEMDGNILNAVTPDDGYRTDEDGMGINSVNDYRYDDHKPWQYKESSKRSKRYHAEYRDEFSVIGYYGLLITAGLLGLVMLILATNGLITTIRFW